jgi:serine/threonine protein kinase
MSERNVLLKNVKHPFLVGLHFSFQTADKLYFVLDYINGGEVSRGIHLDGGSGAAPVCIAWFGFEMSF